MILKVLQDAVVIDHGRAPDGFAVGGRGGGGGGVGVVLVAGAEVRVDVDVVVDWMRGKRGS
jgi:hypothetical protein